MKTKTEIITVEEFFKKHINPNMGSDPILWKVTESPMIAFAKAYAAEITDTLLQDEQKQAQERHEKAIRYYKRWIDKVMTSEKIKAFQIASGFNPPKTQE